MIARLARWLVQMLVCIDQLMGTWLRGWHYVWIGGELPQADETISSWIGRRAQEGVPWARTAELFIDATFFWQRDHCQQSIEFEDLDG